MRVLADENFPRSAVEALRAAGHDVVWVRTEMAGAADEHVLARARAEFRLVVTFDKDFGELAFNSRLPAECGVVLFRCRMASPETTADRVVAALDSPIDWPGHFSVVEDARIRVRPMPA